MHQQRFEFDNLPPFKNRKCQFFVWQPEVFDAAPWCIAFDGRNTGRGDVTIHHACIPNGRVTFPNLNLNSPDEFAEFCFSMLKVYQGFGGNIVFRTQDFAALRDGYREGVKG